MKSSPTIIAQTYLDLAILTLLLIGGTIAFEPPRAVATNMLTLEIGVTLIAALSGFWLLRLKNKHETPDQTWAGRFIWIAILLWLAGFGIAQIAYSLFTSTMSYI